MPCAYATAASNQCGFLAALVALFTHGLIKSYVQACIPSDCLILLLVTGQLNSSAVLFGNLSCSVIHQFWQKPCCCSGRAF